MARANSGEPEVEPDQFFDENEEGGDGKNGTTTIEPPTIPAFDIRSNQSHLTPTAPSRVNEELESRGRQALFWFLPVGLFFFIQKALGAFAIHLVIYLIEIWRDSSGPPNALLRWIFFWIFYFWIFYSFVLD